jgi:CubicO group peptidase (beta-lactamase class C family)
LKKRKTIKFLLMSFVLLPTLAGQTVADPGAFLDGAVPKQLSREKIAGAVVAVVKDRDVPVSRGYGFADIEKKIPMTGEVPVRPASMLIFAWFCVVWCRD